MQNVHGFTVLPALPESLKDLDFVARNMFWSWNPEFTDLFRRMDNNLWASCGHNPVRLINSITQDRLEKLAKDQGFLSELQRIAQKLRAYLDSSTWFENINNGSGKQVIAYFGAEFGIDECLPIYAGGLGILAGDNLKSASDLGIPMVGIGLLYQKGYFRQYLNVDGWQQEAYVSNDFYNMPIELVCGSDGQPLTISVEYPDRLVHAQIWKVLIGRIVLYLMDTNVTANSLADRLITANLYGGDREMRIRQEIILGIGGLRALRAMGITPTVCHMNEGHAAFMALERIRELREDKNMSFDEALEASKASNVFTIHTLVKAGLDEFSVQLMDKYFGNYFDSLGISRDEFLSLGRILPDDANESFKMPILALRLSSYRNGVSRLHGDLSRKMWAGLWPGVPADEVPITSVTNGVHIKTWLSNDMNCLYERYLGSNWTNETVDRSVWENIDNIPDEEFWRTHQRCKEHLIAFARNRLKTQLKRRGTYHTELNWAEEVLDAEALTIGFARRFASYKRANLLLRDPNRLVKLLTDKDRPLQILFAGKAHPKDTEGKEIIRQIVRFATQHNVRRNIVFLENYDIDVARLLVSGVDIWLNNPRRPMEASGTSGMKAAMNGVLNMSTLDGWWCEGYKPEAGWVIGAGENYGDANYQDVVEAQAIYNILENEAVPLFYTRSAEGLPRGWIRRMKNCIKWIAPQFNTHRLMSDYAEKFYVPAGAKWHRLTADDMSKAKAFSKWKSNIKTAWPGLSIKDVQVQFNNGKENVELPAQRSRLKVGSKVNIRALIKLDGIHPGDVAVELYYGALDGWGNIGDGSAMRMDHEKSSGPDGEHWFNGLLPCSASGRLGFSVRVLPKHEDMPNPHELGLILWEGTAENKNT